MTFKDKYHSMNSAERQHLYDTLNVPRQTVWQWLHGTIPTLGYAVILRDKYGIPVESWLTGR